jgi:thiol-disulfide isomerase/thioredoxin
MSRIHNAERRGARGVGSHLADLLRGSAVQLPAEGHMPALDGATGWLNSEPLTPAGLRGKVVLADIWTYTCINWLRTLPYVRTWAERYKDEGLVVIGIHTPEFDFEHDIENVRRAVRDLGVDYPVAIDNHYALWDAFHNHYWPALYFIDAEGHIRHHRFGEGDYERSQRVVQQLLAEAGTDGAGEELPSVEAPGIEAAADWDDLGSPETYLGYGRGERFASPDPAAWDKSSLYRAPARLRLNEWALVGEWTLRDEAAVVNTAHGRIRLRFHARDVHLVMAPATRGRSVRFRVTVDDQPPGPSHGLDVDDHGNGVVTLPRLYQLVRQSGPTMDRDVEIEFIDPGACAYALTFG